MRTEQEMLDLILSTAKNDDRVRAVIMNGSRANPNAPRDPFQDFDIVYVVTDIKPFKRNLDWIKRFGELMILQLPDDMQDPPPEDKISYAYLMQFADGNRIDLTILPIENLNARGKDSLSLLLLDKDNLIGSFPPANDSDYIPKPPTAKQFTDCCNEFWWVNPYVAKGLWRREILYAKDLAEVVREEMMKMLRWYIGVKTQFSISPGKNGKYFNKYLEPEIWDMLMRTYSDASYESTWDSLFIMGDLFRMTALHVAKYFGFDYPDGDDERVTSHLKHVRLLPRDAIKIY